MALKLGQNVTLLPDEPGGEPRAAIVVSDVEFERDANDVVVLETVTNKDGQPERKPKRLDAVTVVAWDSYGSQSVHTVPTSRVKGA